MSAESLKHHVERAARRAQIAQTGVHRLRHTFCSHLAMRGARVRAIQELAAHQDLTTTQRYMHVSPAASDSAIRMLDDSEFWRDVGDDGSLIRYLQSAVCFSWRGRRDSNPN
jgi:integrase